VGGASNDSELSTTAIFGDLGGHSFGNVRDKANNIIWRYAALVGLGAQQRKVAILWGQKLSYTHSLHTLSRNFSVDGDAANLLRTC